MRKRIDFGYFVRSLLFVTLITTLLSWCTVGVFARYSTTVSGTATLRVAKFDVEITYPDAPPTFALTADEPGTYEFTVVNNSDVAVNGTVKVDFTETPPAGISLTVNGTQTLSTDGVEKSFIFSDAAFDLNYTNDSTDDEKTVTLMVSADASATVALSTITVSVDVVQVIGEIGATQ